MSPAEKSIKEIFLGHDRVINDDQSHVYSLNNEFRDSATNFDPKIYFIVTAFLFILIITAIITQVITQQQERSVAIDISEFEDIKLQELLASIGGSHNTLQNAKRELRELEVEHQHRVTTHAAEYRRKLDELSAISLPEAELADATTVLEESNRQAVDKFINQYKLRKGTLESEIATLEKNIATQRGSVSADEGDKLSVQNPEQQLYQLKMDQLRSDYEQKISLIRSRHQQEIERLINQYNPTFSEPDLLEIIDQPAARVAPAQAMDLSTKNYLQDRSISSTQQMDNLNGSISAQNRLIKRLQQIPFRNSPQRTMFHLQSINYSILNENTRIQNLLAENLQRQDQTISHFTHLLQHLARSRGENGYVIDPRNRSEMAIYIDSDFKITTGDQAVVFRKDNEPIALIEFHLIDGQLRAHLKKSMSQKEMQPFDKILLKLGN